MVNYLAIGFVLSFLSSVGGVGLAVAHRQIAEAPGYDVAELGAQFIDMQSDARPVVAGLPAVEPARAALPADAPGLVVAVPMHMTAAPAATLRPMPRPAGLAAPVQQIAVVIALGSARAEVTVSSKDSAASRQPVAQEVKESAPADPASSRIFLSPRYLIGVYR